jgi:hypothetical protein
MIPPGQIAAMIATVSVRPLAERQTQTSGTAGPIPAGRISRARPPFVRLAVFFG